jgi:uncharacterized protein
MKLFSVLIAISWMLCSLVISQAAQASEFGIFKPHTIYTADKNGFKDKVIILFHGLGSAHPNGTFRRLEKELSGDYSVVGVNYDYMDIDRNIVELKDLWQRYLVGHDVYVLGTSLGGFWADYFANTYDVKRQVLVNPVTRPEVDLKQFLGVRFSEQRRLEYKITEADLLAYSKIKIPINKDIESLVILTKDDPVIDYRAALKKYSNLGNSQLIIRKSGGHSLPLSDPLYLEVLKLFLRAE